MKITLKYLLTKSTKANKGGVKNMVVINKKIILVLFYTSVISLLHFLLHKN